MVRTIAILAILACAGTAFADPVLDQSFTPASPTSSALISSTVNWAQTFTVGATGTLTSVDVLVRRDGVITDNLVVDVQSTTGGLPDGTSLGSVSVAPASVNNGAAMFVAVDISDFDVTSGDVLAIVLTSAQASGMPDYFWVGKSTGGYAGGTALIRSGSPVWRTSFIGDLGFNTYVDSMDRQIPEPAMMLLLAAGLGVVVYRRRR